MKMMKYNISLKIAVLVGSCVIFLMSCDRETSDDLRPATFPNSPNVFIDGFSGALEYLPFAGSRLDAFTVDDETFYSGAASMRFNVPNGDDPKGAFAGAIFRDPTGRNLTGYDALTFWAQSSKPATITFGLGQDFEENKFQVETTIRLSTGWNQYTIPLPDASKLVAERGLFWYSAGAQPEGPEGEGFTFWVDELKYERLGTIAQPNPSILGGFETVLETFIGATPTIGQLRQTLNLASGINMSVSVTPAYMTFSSSDTTVATVNDAGQVNVVGSGNATITALLKDTKARGSLMIQSIGMLELAATPTRDAANVLSIFSDAYTDIPVNGYNGNFGGQTTQGGSVDLNGDAVILYTDLNFVGIPLIGTVDVSQFTHLHVDVQVREPLNPSDVLTVELIDFGANGVFDGPSGDDTGGGANFASATLQTGSWVSLDIPLDGFTQATGGGFAGSPNTTNLAQVVFVSGGISEILIDNIYFYK